MTESLAPVVRLSDQPLESWTQGTFYGSADAVYLGDRAGLKSIGFGYSEVAPGKSSCPFHSHHMEDEMFVVLAGEGTYRFGKERYAFKAGDVLVAPAGGHETAHQIINTGSETLRYVAISNKSTTEVTEYPDSGKVLISSRAGGTAPKLRHMSRAGEHHIENYWDGEPGAEETAS